MRKVVFTFAVLLVTCATILTQAAQAAPRQVVVIVAEGLSPQVLELGTAYVKYPAAEGNTSAFDTLMAQSKAQTAGAVSLDAWKGILKTAAASGYKTGLVTTEDVATVASTLYDVGAGGDAARTLATNTKFDFLGGGGRKSFSPEVVQAFTQGGGTSILDAEKLQNTEQDIKGKVLALQSDAALSYALDRAADEEGGLGDLATLALDTLSANNAPFLLVIHDGNLSRAIAAKDTPALMGEFRELDTIVNTVLGLQEENKNLALAVVAAGGTTVPKLTTTVENERSNTFFVLSELPLSYSGAGKMLQGANDEKLNDFIENQYKGWKIAPDNRAALIAGTMTPEAAIRASYEPVLRINYEGANAQPVVYAVGLNIEGDLMQTLSKWAASQPGQ